MRAREPAPAQPLTVVLVTDRRYLPERVGTRETSVHALAEHLARAGHKPIVVARPGSRSPIVSAVHEDWRPSYTLIHAPDVFAKAERLLLELPLAFALYLARGAHQALSGEQAVRRRQGLVVEELSDAEAWGPETIPPEPLLLATSSLVADRLAAQSGRPATVLELLPGPDPQDGSGPGEGRAPYRQFIDLLRERTASRPRVLPNGETEMHSTVLLCGSAAPALIERSLLSAIRQTRRPAAVYLAVDPAAENAAFADEIAGRHGGDIQVAIVRCERSAGSSALFRRLRELDSPFVSLAQGGDLFEPDHAETLLRGHLNRVTFRAVATSNQGFWRPGAGPLALRTCKPSDPGGSQDRDHQSDYDFSVLEPSWQVQPAAATGTGAMYRRDALLMLDGAKLDGADNGLELLRIGAHILGGSIHVDRVLAWRVLPRQGEPGGLALISQHQKAMDPVTPALKRQALKALLANGAARMVRRDILVTTLRAHFPADVLLEMTVHEDLAAVLVEVASGL